MSFWRRTNGPAVDPTKNVLETIEAVVSRQDDLRNAESRHLHQIGKLREHFNHELREAETARIDAIRAVDVGAVNRAAEVSATQAATLAVQVATSAEALRAQVEAARQQTATALAAALEPIQKDIQDLRRAQYEAQGQKTQGVETQGRQSSAVGLWIAFVGVVIAAATALAIVLSANHGALCVVASKVVGC
jgi:hypothetical protein